MKRSTKLLLGILTIWPIIYMGMFIAFIFGMIALSRSGPMDPEMSPVFGVGMMAIFVLHFLTMLLMLGLTVFYIIHVIKNDAVKSDMKAVWAVLFFVGGVIAQPVYWYLNIWKAPGDGSPLGSLSAANTSTWDFESKRHAEYQSPSGPPDWR